VRAHVQAVSQQRHRPEQPAGDQLNHPRDGGERDDDERPRFPARR
jgi:hypothetical protein